jgi:cell fate regulator YaaT (PSP1 superfamily)
MPAVVEVRFKGNRREFYTWDRENLLAVGDPVVVPAERGEDLGFVSAVGGLAERKCGVACEGCALGAAKEPVAAIVRPATSDEAYISEQLRIAEQDVRRKVMERVRTHGLAMKVSDAEWQWDRKKLTVFFTADKRIDFRALVRDLASLFRTRIELRQIGARDESKRLDGVGRCGRQYCCSSWLPELRPVSLSLAKEQRLSLNPTQISGGCGRLLCCLRYEHDFYVSARKRFPKIGKALQTSRGREVVEAIDIFRDRVLLRAGDQTRSERLDALRQEVTAREPAPAVRPKEPARPTARTPDATALTTEEAVQAVSPRKRRRRRSRRRGSRNRQPPKTDDGDRKGDGIDG